MKHWRNHRGPVVEYRPVPKVRIQTGDRDRVSWFTAVQAPQMQVHVWERTDWSELDSRGWEYGVQLSADTRPYHHSQMILLGGKKIPPALRVAPFVSALSISASRAAKAGPRHGDVPSLSDH